MEPIILLLGVISVCSVGVGTVTVIQDPPFLNLSAGDTARMSCVVKNVKVGETLNHSWNLHGSWENMRNSSRMTVTPNSLTISSVTPKDSGLYTCIVRDNTLLPYRGNGTYLSVTGQRLYVYIDVQSQPWMWSGWGHLLSSGAVFVLYTGLLSFIVNDLRKMKNEKNRSERRTRRRDEMEMEMEPTYYDDCY